MVKLNNQGISFNAQAKLKTVNRIYSVFTWKMYRYCNMSSTSSLFKGFLNQLIDLREITAT